MKRMMSLFLSIIVAVAVTLNLAASVRMPADENGGHRSLASSRNFLPLIARTEVSRPVPVDSGAWPMAAANQERTSWTPEEVRGPLFPLWYKTFEPYIPQRVQIVAAYDLIYVATAKGLYALDATSGAQRWVYPTDMPLGHSPTIHRGVAYVGGMDRKLHAIDALTGDPLWTFAGAAAGFQTNPLVVDEIVYLGNRDRAMYAIGAHGTERQGELIWKYQTGGPILYSAAYHDDVVFFASNDMRAYALDASTGTLVWKSEKLPGAGFFSWWPVVYQDRVIYSGSNNYRNTQQPGGLDGIREPEREDIYPNRDTNPIGTFIGETQAQVVTGDWADGTPVLDATPILDYFQQKPWRRSVYVLDRFTGQDREIAPVLWTGTHSGSRYPPIVGVDNLLYQQNSYLSHEWIPGGQVSGWQPGVPYISIVSSDWGAVDEPHAYSSGGSLIYWNLCCDREAGAYDITVPNSVILEDAYNRGYTAAPRDNAREWSYFAYNLDQLIPGYNTQYYNPHPTDYTFGTASFGGPNGVYGFVGDTNPPIPYEGRVYMHRSNAIIAFEPAAGTPVALPTATVVASEEPQISVDSQVLKAKLVEEVQAMVEAGHLRPGFTTHGLFDSDNNFNRCGDDLVDYWHNPSETLYTLLLALPHLPDSMQIEVRDYLQSEFSEYPPYEYYHIGWRDGAPREWAELPPEVAIDVANYPPESENLIFKNPDVTGVRQDGIWGRNPFLFYTLWKYAQEFGNAEEIYAASKDRLEAPPADDVLAAMPFVHNAFIAGYLGYLQLEELAGKPESVAVRQELESLLTLRAQLFTKDSAYGQEYGPLRYCRTLNVASNFMYLVPELADHLRQNTLLRVRAAVEEYTHIAPYWFVSFATEGFEENAVVPLYDTNSLFAAKAMILDESAAHLAKYLDVPAFAQGDLFFIQKLVLLIESTQ